MQYLLYKYHLKDVLTSKIKTCHCKESLLLNFSLVIAWLTSALQITTSMLLNVFIQIYLFSFFLWKCWKLNISLTIINF